MVEDLAADSVVALETRGDRAGIREDPACLEQPDPIDLCDELAGAAVLRRGGEVAERRAELVVGLAILVEQPDDLVGVADGVAREPGGDDGVDALAARLGQVQAAPGEGSANQVEPLTLGQRNRDEVRLDAAAAKLLRQPSDVPLGSPLDERGLDSEDEDPAAQRVSARRLTARALPRPARRGGRRSRGPGRSARSPGGRRAG